jgi:hemoglobin
MTLYDEIGGEAAVAAVVADWWHRGSTDELLAAWFGGVEPEMFTAHLRAYLAVAFGGPEAYRGRSMACASPTGHS